MLPLENKRVLITRAKSDATDFVKAVEKYGAIAVCLPVIDIQIIKSPIPSVSPDILIFTSVNAVKALKENATESFTNYFSIPTYAVGDKTKAYLTSLGFQNISLPETYNQEALLDIIRSDLKGKTVLIPRGDKSSTLIETVLKQRGCNVVAPVLYANTPISYNVAELGVALTPAPHFITFASASAVEAFFMNSVEGFLQNAAVKYLAIGPSTAYVLNKHVAKHYTAQKHTVDGLVELMLEI